MDSIRNKPRKPAYVKFEQMKTRISQPHDLTCIYDK